MYLESDDHDKLSSYRKDLSAEQIRILKTLFFHNKADHYHQEIKSELSINSKERQDYRNYVINHLNQSFLISSPFGRLISYIKAFLEKYVELRN